jgi:hypothetical protein
MTTAATTRGYSTSNECKLENRGGIQRVESGLFDGEDWQVTGQFCVEFFFGYLVNWGDHIGLGQFRVRIYQAVSDGSSKFVGWDIFCHNKYDNHSRLDRISLIRKDCRVMCQVELNRVGFWVICCRLVSSLRSIWVRLGWIRFGFSKNGV